MKPATIYLYLNAIRNFLEYFRSLYGHHDLDLENLEAPDIIKYYTRLANTYSPEYLQIQRSAIIGFLDYYRKTGKNICQADLMKVKKKTNPIAQIISENDIQVMLHKLNTGEGLSKSQNKYYEKTKYRDICIIKLMLHEGLTSKECAALNCSDLDESISTLQVRRTNDHYLIKLSKELQEDFSNYLDSREEYIEEREQEVQEEALFINIQTKRISDRAIQKMVHNYSYDEYSDTSLTPTMLREYCILNKLKNGENIIMIMRHFGFRSIISLEKYINALL